MLRADRPRKILLILLILGGIGRRRHPRTFRENLLLHLAALPSSLWAHSGGSDSVGPDGECVGSHRIGYRVLKAVVESVEGRGIQ